MKKVVSCILSFLPLLMIFLTMIVFFLSYFIIGEGTMTAGETIFMLGLVLFTLIAVVLTFALMIWYMIKACKNPEFSVGMKVLWCVLLYCFNIMAFPVYWILYIRKE